jgi:hypothetical protein
MKTMFNMTPFNRPAFSPGLEGPLDWVSDLWSEVKDLAPTVTDLYKGYTSAEKAEEERKAAQARAAAAAAQAQAATAQAATQQASGGVLGIPTTYLVVGGLGLLAVGAIVLLAKKSS